MLRRRRMDIDLRPIERIIVTAEAFSPMGVFE